MKIDFCGEDIATLDRRTGEKSKIWLEYFNIVSFLIARG